MWEFVNELEMNEDEGSKHLVSRMKEEGLCEEMHRRLLLSELQSMSLRKE